MVALLLLMGLALAGPDKVSTFVEAEDGGFTAVHRYANPGKPAVVLVHGISSNHHFWDLQPDRSLALTLHGAGYDVWNVDLRGHGDAVRLPDGRRQKPNWTMDDYGTQDLPAIFTRIQNEAPDVPIHFVGHSMGGMVLAVYLARTPADQVPLSSAVAVGSPLDFRDPDVLVGAMLGAGEPVLKPLGKLPTPLGAKLIAPFGRTLVGQVDQLLHNPENMDRKTERHMLHTVVSPLYEGEARQFSMTKDTGEFTGLDGMVYRTNLGHVQVPMLFFAGRADHVVSPDRVFSYFDAIGSKDKEFVIASTANGMHGDYGHLDLGLGDNVAADIYAPILRWLEEHP